MRRAPNLLRLLDRPAIAIAVSVALAVGLFVVSRHAESAEPLRVGKPARIAAAVAQVADIPAPTSAGTPADRAVGQPIPGRYIVVMQDDAAAPRSLVQRIVAPRDAAAASATAIDRLATRHGVRNAKRFRHVVRGFVGTLDDAQLARMRADPAVKHVEPDRLVRIQQVEAGAAWGRDRIDQRDLPLDGAWVPPGTGAGVNVYVIDTGIRATHAEFDGRVRTGFSALAGDAREDCNGHGTHVAGTIAGATRGVAPDVTLHPVRVLACDGTGTLSDVVAGIDWVAANHVKPAVANLSLGVSAVSRAFGDAVRGAIAAGVTVVVAAGNDGIDACATTPGHVREALVVGATAADDRRAWWSNRGTCVDLHAPGVGITAAGMASDTAFATMSGTSMATPHVAGAAALWLSRHPAAAPADIHDAIVASASVDRLRGHLVSGLWDTPWTWRNGDVGTPNRLLHLGTIALAPGSAPVARAAVRCEGLTCRFDATASTDDVGIASATWNVDGRAVLRGVSAEHTFPGPLAGDATVVVTDTHGRTSHATVRFDATGTPPAPCGACRMFSGIANGRLYFGPEGNPFRIETPTRLSAWLARPYDTTDLPLPVWQRLALVTWNGTDWVDVATTAGSGVALALAPRVDAPGWYAWRIDVEQGATQVVLWWRNDAVTGGTKPPSNAETPDRATAEPM